MWKIKNQKYQQTDWERIYSLSPSGYIRKGTLQVFHKIRKNFPDDHILCIGYSWGDTQFAITETFKTYETHVDDVVDRCLQEELSMERIEKMECIPYIYNERFATIYCVPFRATHENLQSCHYDPVPEKDLDKDDDKTRKLVLLLHGPFPVIQKLFARFSSLEHNISHLISIPMTDINFVFPKFFPFTLYPPKKSFLPTTTPKSIRLC